MTSQSRTTWLGPLDSYRSLAALAVFAFHIASISPRGGVLGAWTVPLGSAAVSLFFALSGFLIYRPFAAWAFGIGDPVPGVRFALRRIARIAPLYWAVLVVHLFILGRGGAESLADYATAFGLVQNFRGDKVFIPPFVAWSLCIELWFSMLLPFFAFVVRKIGSKRNLRTRLHIQLAGFVWLAGAATVFRIWALDLEQAGGEILWFPAYFDWFVAGITLATATTFWQLQTPSPTIQRLARRPIPLAMGAGCYWAITRIGIPGGFTAPTAFQTHAQFLLQAAMSFCLLSAVVLPNSQLGSLKPGPVSRVLSWLAPLSYGIYLVHPVVIDEFLHRSKLSVTVLTPIALVGTIGSAFILHHAVERPASTLADRHLRVTPKTVPAENEASLQTSTLTSTSISTEPPAFEPSPNPTGNGTALPETPMQPANPADSGFLNILNRMSVLSLVVSAWTLAITLLARPGIYVADARFELFADPTARLRRSFQLWDATRDFGRTAEEFWPGLVLFSSAIAGAGAPEWATERALHACLLTIACTGAMYLSRTLGRSDLVTTVFAGAIYAFGPFSATYLVPSPLYVSHALAPWAVVGVIKAARDEHALRWAGITALGIFLAGNADVPGLIFALVPALITWIACVVARPQGRRPLVAYTAAIVVATGLASAAMLAKTAAGAAALSHRLVETESAAAVSSSSSMAESMRGMGFWLSYFRLGPVPVRSQSQLFLESWFMVLFTFLPLLAGIAVLAWRHRPSDLLAVSWLLAAVVLMTGPHPIDGPSPYGSFLLDLYERSDLAFGFRSTHKAGVGVALATAMLGSSGLAKLPLLIPSHQLRRRWIGAAGAIVILLTYTQPFWRTPLYDPAFTSGEIPHHWEETERWFDDNPPEGRVLVLPGSSNNGYRWGSVGDDLLDPTIPNRLTASTLPLSTPIAAAITQAIDDMVTSDRYTAGSLSPLAARLGISHIVIRNDLDWELQGLPRPRLLQQLRADPAINAVATFGTAGLFSTSALDPARDEIERSLPAVEIFALDSPTAEFTRFPDGDQRRQILLSGDGDGLTAAASQGLLSTNHPVRFAGAVDDNSISEIADDVALIILTDTNRQGERRIGYYGYSEIPVLARDAEVSNTANHWIPSLADPRSQTTVTVDGVRVSSSVDPWLLGADNQPSQALDGDPTTSWLIPVLAQGSVQTWSVEFDDLNQSTFVDISLLDEGVRVQDFRVLIDGQQATITRSDDQISIEPAEPFRQIELHFGALDIGLHPAGLRDLVLSDAQPVMQTQLPTGLVDQISQNSAIANSLTDVPLAVVFADIDASRQSSERLFDLWRDDTFTFQAEIFTAPAEQDESTNDAATRWPLDDRCFYGPLLLDGVFYPVSFSPHDDGRGMLQLCEGSEIGLAEGHHQIQVRAPEHGDVGSVMLRSAQDLPSSLDQEHIESNERLRLTVGDLILSNRSFDDGWVLVDQEGNAATTVSLNGLTAWKVTQTMDVATPTHRQSGSLKLALYLTGLGILTCLALIGPKQPSFAKPILVAATDVRSTAVVVSSGNGWVAVAVLYLVVTAVSWTFVGPFGLLGAMVILLLRPWLRAGRLFALSSLAIAATAAATTYPLLVSGATMVDVQGEASLGRVAIGALFATAVCASRRENPATTRVG